MRPLSYKVGCAVRYIEDHLFDETLAASAVEQHVANGCAQLRTQFKRETGYTIGRWIEAARLRRASDLLAGSESSIAEIAFAVGYASHEVFCRAFRRVLGMSPTQYRRKHQAKLSSEIVKTQVSEPAILYSVRATLSFLRGNLHSSTTEVPDGILTQQNPSSGSVHDHHEHAASDGL